MHNYRFSNALGYTLAQMSEMHNTSFSGYYVPITMTPEMTADFWRLNQIDALRSVVMHDEAGAFVGMARMGTRGTRGWCGGFGIAPDFRGSGASTLLAERMVQIAQVSGLTSLQLEVLTQNIRAFKVYEKVGFRPTRKLFGLEIASAALPADESAPQVERVALTTLLPRLVSATEQACWGRELSALLTPTTEALVGFGPDGQLNGLLVRRSGEKVRIQALILQSALTDAQLAGLLHQAAGEATGIQVMNEPESSPLLARYRALGFSEFYSQYEMFLKF